MILTPEERTALIAELKAQQDKLRDTPRENDNLATLIGALPSMRLVLAWPKLKIGVPVEPIEIADNLTAIQKLWSGVTVDLEEAAVIARIPITLIEQHVREAQAFCWVWPDGTNSENAVKLAKTTITRLAKGNEKGR